MTKETERGRPSLLARGQDFCFSPSRRAYHPRRHLRKTGKALCASWLIAAAAPAWPDDPRVIEQTYEPGTVYKLEGSPSIQTMIRFVQGEQIESIAIGDSSAWQVTPNKRADLLFVKSLTSTATTNMTVVTDHNTYVFDLIASPGASPIYALRFIGPSDVSQGVEILAEEIDTGEQRQHSGPTSPYAIIDPSALSFDWRQSGDSGLLPNIVYDDGRRTFLVWPQGRRLPALFSQDGSKAEVPLGFAARGQMAVVDGVPARIILRSETSVATLTHAN